MAIFDPLTYMEHLLTEAKDEIILLLLGFLGVLMIWVTFRKLR